MKIPLCDKRARPKGRAQAVMAWGLVLACIIMAGCGSDNSGKDAKWLLNNPPWETAALFGWNNRDRHVFTQHVKDDGTMGRELMSGTWENTYESMARFNVGDRQFIMGLRKDGDWFIQELLPTGDPGRVTDSGHFNNYYATLVGFQVDGKPFIFGQKSDTNYWFIQEINKDGTMGSETDNGSWHYFYPTLTPVQVSDKTYLFGQTNKDNNFYFLQEVYDDGTMASNMTDSGKWGHYFDTATTVLQDGHTYLFGQTSKKEHWYEAGHYFWFLQEVHYDGTMGSETDNGYWYYFYDTVTAVRVSHKTYLFGQTNKDNNFWFLQEVHYDGTMASNTTDSGQWDRCYDFVFPFYFDGSYLDISKWMKDNYGLIKDRSLLQISLPGSHDAGMHTDTNCYHDYASECNTITQVSSIGEQLEDGARYFDLRPVYDMDSTSWWTGHFGTIGELFTGCTGESLRDALLDVRNFLDREGYEKELVILDFSHCWAVEGSVAWDGCSDEQWQSVIDMIQDWLGADFLIMCEDCNPRTMTVDDILAINGNNVIVRMENENSQKAQGIFSYDDLPIYNKYSNTNDLNKMEEDQIKKLLKNANHLTEKPPKHRQMFLLSWTLTLSGWDAVSCVTDVAPSILDLAHEAGPKLIPNLDEQMAKKKITKSLFPNILYVDNFGQFATRAAIYMNLNYENME